MPDELPVPEGRSTISPRTQADLDRAIKDIFRLAADESQREWPTERLQSALARDGDHRVIEYMSARAARAVYALAQETGESPVEVTRQIHDQFDQAYLPFFRTAWARARVLTLHRLVGQPIEVTDEEITAVELVGGLALIHVVAVVRVAGVRK